MERLREFQQKAQATVAAAKAKLCVTSLMAAMAAGVVSALGKRCLLVLDAYFAVGPVFAILKHVHDGDGRRLVHIVTRAKSNVVAFSDPPPKTGGRGRPRTYGDKLKLIQLFDTHGLRFEQLNIELYGKLKQVSYRFKIEVSFKVLKHLMGAFFYRFWTHAWPRIGKATQSELAEVTDQRRQNLIADVANAIEAFVNFGCIATGILQMLALNFHETIWQRYMGWLRTVSSTVPSEEVVKSVIQQEYYHNFRSFSTDAIYRIIMSKSRKSCDDILPLAA